MKKKFALCAASDFVAGTFGSKPIVPSLVFDTRKEAEDKLRDLTERGVISGIPVVIVEHDAP